MTFKLLTIFPDMLRAVLGQSILGRAINSGAINAEVIDIRAFSTLKHKNTDDAPYGGGAGMVMLAQATGDAIKYAMGEDFKGKRIYLSPKGRRFDQHMAEELSRENEIILLAGHYEGLDQRVIDSFIDEEISVGDYVLTGGELGALIITDAVARLLPGVLGSDESSVDESFSSGLLEYPHYTRPREFEGLSVPEVLLNGDQAEIEGYRRREALKMTLARRPEMLKTADLNGFDRAYLRGIMPSFSQKICLFDAENEHTELRARLYELRNGLVEFVQCEKPFSFEGDALCAPDEKRLLLTHLPTKAETDAAQSAGITLFGFTPYAFCPRFSELIGDDSLETLVFSGVNEEEFACLAALWLPVRKVANGAVYFAKSRRALLKNGPVPACEAITKTGENISFRLSAHSNAFLNAALSFLKTARPPLTEATVSAAREVMRARSREGKIRNGE